MTIPRDLAARNAYLLAEVRAGRVAFDWHELELGDLRVWTTRDALKWDGIRYGVDAYTQQQIADALGAVLETPALSDRVALEAHQHGGLVVAYKGPVSFASEAFEKHSRDIDAALPADYRGIVSAFKGWGLSRDCWTKPGKATNYGLHVPRSHPQWSPIPVAQLQPSLTVPSLWVVQGPHEAHGAGRNTDADPEPEIVGHADGSQMCRVYRRAALYRNARVDLGHIYTGRMGPIVTALVSHEGALPNYRLPGVPVPVHEVDDPTERPTRETPPPYTAPHDHGPAVVAWQEHVIAFFQERGVMAMPKFGADGDHGNETEEWTQKYFELRGVEIVRDPDVPYPLDRPTPITSRPPDTQPNPPTPATHDTDQVMSLGPLVEWANEVLDGIPFRQAKYYNPGRRFGPAIFGVLHTDEQLENPGGAEALQNWAATMIVKPPAQGVSWTMAVDNNSATMSVRLEDTPYACPGLNERGVHWEMCGRTSQGVVGWADAFSVAVIRNTAEIVAAVIASGRTRINPVWVDFAQLLAGVPGITDHNEGRLALLEAKKRNLRVAPWWNEEKRVFKSTSHIDVGWNDQQKRAFVDAVRSHLGL